MKLSIIIPEYNAEGLLPDLLACLDKQIQATKHEVEVFIIDDGSKVPFSTDYPWAQVFRKQNEGPGIARNVGLEHMTGDYFTFIDADDMVADNYLEAIFDKTAIFRGNLNPVGGSVRCSSIRSRISSRGSISVSGIAYIRRPPSDICVLIPRSCGQRMQILYTGSTSMAKNPLSMISCIFTNPIPPIHGPRK